MASRQLFGQNQNESLPHLRSRRKIEQNKKNGGFHFSMIKLCCEVFPISNFKVICLEENEGKSLRNRCIITFFTLTLVHTLGGLMQNNVPWQTAVFPSRLH